MKLHNVTEPWKPASYLHIPEEFKNPNFVYRAVDKNRPGNIDKKLAEGWEIDLELSEKMGRRRPPTIMDGAPLDSTFHIRELVIMRLPKDRAEARKKYYEEMSDRARKSATQSFKDGVSRITENYKDSGYYETEDKQNFGKMEV